MRKTFKEFSSRTKKLYEINKIFSSRATPISKKEIAEKIGCPVRTLDRVLEDYQKRFPGEIKYCGKSRGWHKVNA